MAENDNKDDKKPVVLKPGETIVDQKMLTNILEKQAEMEKTIADEQAKRVGLEALFAEQSGVDTNGDKKLRERKNFEPAFRTVALKKYPIAGNHEDLGYVIGWTNRGAYKKINREGVAPEAVDYIDILYYGRERGADGKLQAEPVALLDLINAPEINCKILEVKKNERKEPTGEEINVSIFDPKHGLMETGDIIDGWVGFTDRSFVIQIPGIVDPVTIDEKYVNI